MMAIFVNRMRFLTSLVGAEQQLLDGFNNFHRVVLAAWDKSTMILLLKLPSQATSLDHLVQA